MGFQVWGWAKSWRSLQDSMALQGHQAGTTDRGTKSSNESQGLVLYCQRNFSVALSWFWLSIAPSLADFKAFKDKLLLVN